MPSWVLQCTDCLDDDGIGGLARLWYFDFHYLYFFTSSLLYDVLITLQTDFWHKSELSRVSQPQNHGSLCLSTMYGLLHPNNLKSQNGFKSQYLYILYTLQVRHLHPHPRPIKPVKLFWSLSPISLVPAPRPAPPGLQGLQQQSLNHHRPPVPVSSHPLHRTGYPYLVVVVG